MKASEIELSRVDAECLTQMPGDGSIGVNQVAPMARAFLHLHGILTATLPDDLAAIEARAEDATPGPWWQGDTEDEPRGDADCVYAGKERLVAPLAWESDAAFIAHARADVPRLLTGIRAQAATIRERDAEVARLDRLAKAERALRAAEHDLCVRLTDRAVCGYLALDGGCQDARVAVRDAGGEP